MKVYNENILSKLLDFIKTYQSRNGKSPSYREIMRGMNFSSLSMVYRYIKLLNDKNLIEKDGFGSIEISKNLKPDKTILAPIVGLVTCGKPIYAQEDIEGTYQLPMSIFGSGEKFILRAEGDSMKNAGIKSGDLLVINKCNTANNGDIVVALIEDSATVKTFYKKENYVILHPENEKYDDIIEKNVKILGKVEFCIHQL